LLQLLRTADAIWEASRVFFIRWDLSPSQFNVLNLLHFSPRGLSQVELSRELITHRSNITGLVDRLEKRGLLERRSVAGDRRAYRVVLTQSGTRLMKSILPLYYAKAEQAWGNLSSKRVTELVADVQQVAENARRIAAGEESVEPTKKKL
jgi:DNA-binding MarR family transcriptional regulator